MITQSRSEPAAKTKTPARPLFAGNSCQINRLRAESQPWVLAGSAP